MLANLPPPSPRARRSGFTLVEIMAVMAVIAILLSVAAVGIQNISGGQATTTAVSVTEALFDEARSAAVGRGTRARLLIHKNLDDNDSLDRNRYLTYMCVAALETDPNGAVLNDQWNVITRGTPLPAGVYFSAEESQEASQRAGVGSWSEMNIALPGSQQSKECYYYEFNAEGVCVNEQQDAKSGASVILVGGARPKDASEPLMRKNNKAGFVIWRNGRTSLYRDPKQIDEQ